MPFYGTAMLCVDSPAVREILPKRDLPGDQLRLLGRRQVRAVNVRAQAGKCASRCSGATASPLPAWTWCSTWRASTTCSTPVGHRRLAVELNIPDDAVQRALAASGRGPGASSATATSPQGRWHQFTVIDDYGHHPVEMAATLAARAVPSFGRRWCWPSSRTRYSRTRDCFEDFVKVLGGADAVLLTEVYAAGEAPVVAADGRSLARALRVAGRVEPVLSTTWRICPAAIAQRVMAMWCCAWALAPSGLVPGKVADLLQNRAEHRLKGKAQ